MVRKKKKSEQNDALECLDAYPEAEDGFCDGYIDVGTDAIASFSFVTNETKNTSSEELIDNRKLQSQPYGKTPPVDGECFEIKRTFVFRRSTVRMLNRLKAEHPNENAYLSTIVDEALRYYYDYVFSKKEHA